MRCSTPAVVVVAVLAVGCDAGQPPQSGPEPSWEGGTSHEVTLSTLASQESTAGVGADSGTGVSPSVYANSFTRGDPLTLEEFEDPDLRVELSEETNLVVLILRRDEPGWFLRGRGDEVVGSQRFSQRPDGQWEAVARFGPPGQQFEFAWNDEARVVRIEEREVPLGDDNVVLVDRAANEEEFVILGTRRVPDTRFRHGDYGALIRQSAELQEFLRCELPLPDDIPVPDLVPEVVTQYVATIRRAVGRVCEGLP